MDFYVIPPTSELELMNLGNRFFCLAQLYVHPKNSAYRAFFQKKVSEGAWVTLDNGAGDHDLISEQTLINVALDLKPSEVIPPDVLFDSEKTITNLLSFLSNFNNAWVRKYGAFEKKPEIFACPQGENWDEWQFTYKYMLFHPDVTTIGFSKIALPKAIFDVTGDKMIKESRVFAYNFLKAKGLVRKPIHFLGMGDPTEMQHYRDEPFCRSTDSCNTIWAGMNFISFKEGDFQRIQTPKDYFDRQLSEHQYQVATSNIEWFSNSLK